MLTRAVFPQSGASGHIVHRDEPRTFQRDDVVRVLRDKLAFDQSDWQPDKEKERSRNTKILFRWLRGDLSLPIIEDLADEILSRGVEKGWMTTWHGPSFDDYYKARDWSPGPPGDVITDGQPQVQAMADAREQA